MTRLLFLGDLASTGFGTVTSDLGLELLALGVDVRFLSQNELGDLPEPFKSRTFVINEQRIGWHDALNRRLLKPDDLMNGSLWDGWTPECVLILADFYAARGLIFQSEETIAAFGSIPTYHYCPVEGVGLPPSWGRLWNIVHPVAMSGFGADQIAKVTGSRPPVVYHGISKDFWPVSPAKPIRLGDETLRSKDDCKEYIGKAISPGMKLADWKVLLRTDTNVERKNWPSLMRSLQRPMMDHPDLMFLMHTRSADLGGDLRDVWSSVHASVRGRMVNPHWKDDGFVLGRAEMNALYNAADLYVSTSPEGFGLTIAESLACGVPAVGLDYSAVPEVIGPAGKVVPVANLVDNPYAHFWAVPNERKYGETVSGLFSDERERKLLGAKGPFHVREKFTWERAAKQFSDLFSAQRVEVAA